ncbi:putative NAD(P)H dehydrogenase (quinone) FQR1-like 1, partial [Mucuna pruriens]
MTSEFKAFLDATEHLCKTQQLAGNPASIITSTSSQGGGQETTTLTSITLLVHHGMIHEFGCVEEVKGGSPYGAGAYAGIERPTLLEMVQALQHDSYFTSITKQLKEATA